VCSGVGLTPVDNVIVNHHNRELDTRANASAGSMFKIAGGCRWHVLQRGLGSDVLMIHGAGASMHSWMPMLDSIIPTCRVTLVDLPGHGRSGPMLSAFSLQNVAIALGELVHELGLKPSLVVGHSAGAAIACEMALTGAVVPDHLVSINGAFFPFRGGSQNFSPFARLIGRMSPVVSLASMWLGNAERVRRLITDMGSDPERIDIPAYLRLLRSTTHVKATIEMMGNWDLSSLADRMRALTVPLLLIVGERDSAVPPQQAKALLRGLRCASLEVIPNAGHLAHEESPDAVARLILALITAESNPESCFSRAADFDQRKDMSNEYG